MNNIAKKTIYFDNSSTSFLKPPQVSEAVFNAINTMGSPHRGTYPVALNASKLIYSAREIIADFFNVKNSKYVVFTSGGTESLNTAINGVLSKTDHVITTVTEHNSVLRPLYRLGCELSFIPCDSMGCLIVDEIERLIKPTTKAIIVNHVSNVTGNVADIEYISRVCKKNGLYFILDCAQSAGNMFIDSTIADIICFTGHKSLFGVQGTGGMIIAEHIQVNPLKVGGTGQNSYDMNPPLVLPECLEAGTQNCHGIAGLVAGINFIKEVTIEKIAEKETMLTNRFVSGVSKLKNIKLYGNFSQPNRGAIVSLIIDGYNSAELSEILATKYNIATRSGVHCAPLIHKALKTEKTGLTRFSFSYFNTIEEIDYAIEVLSKF